MPEALEEGIRQLRERRETLHTELTGIDDERAKRAAAVLAGRQPRLDRLDLDLLDAILAEPLDAVADADVARCRRLTQLPLPHPDQVAALAEQLAAACAEARRHDESRSRSSMRTAELLRLALEHHDEEGDGPCPVCATGTLDAGWRERCTATLQELRISTVHAKRAATHRDDLVRQIRALISAVDVPESAPDGVPLAKLQATVAALRETPAAPDELAAHLARHYPAVVEAADAARVAAAEWLRQRDSGWQRLAEQVREWVTAVRRLPEQQRAVDSLKAARRWLRAAGDEIRNARLAPFAEHAQKIWNELRQESNVQLGAMTLAGSATRRRVEFPVSVDGVDNGTALGVMSQGEMHALGLATFLPRGCAVESPFRFIVIDDPVQSMDPAKVDGLARVLGELATERQVVVFTHDSRLPDAVRMMEIAADVQEVVRAEHSVVTLRPSHDPVRRYLDDAWAVAKSAEVPEDVRGPVVAELCRSALEAACHRVIWRNKVKNGVRHADIEAAIGQANRLTTTFALALFDDATRGGEVLRTLNQRYGRWAADAYQSCQQGVHGRYAGDLPALVNDIRELTGKLA